MGEKIKLPSGWEGKEEVMQESRKEARQFAMLYHHFAKAIIEEMGEEKGLNFIRNVIRNVAIERGEDMKKAATAAGLPITLETMRDERVRDLPKYTFPPGGHKGDVYCPYGKYWRSKGEDVMRWAVHGYCDVVDPWKPRTFIGPSYKLWRYGKNLNYGHDSCGDHIIIED